MSYIHNQQINTPAYYEQGILPFHDLSKIGLIIESSDGVSTTIEEKPLLINVYYDGLTEAESANTNEIPGELCDQNSGLTINDLVRMINLYIAGLSTDQCDPTGDKKTNPLDMAKILREMQGFDQWWDPEVQTGQPLFPIVTQDTNRFAVLLEKLPTQGIHASLTLATLTSTDGRAPQIDPWKDLSFPKKVSYRHKIVMVISDPNEPSKVTLAVFWQADYSDNDEDLMVVPIIYRNTSAENGGPDVNTQVDEQHLFNDNLKLYPTVNLEIVDQDNGLYIPLVLGGSPITATSQSENK